MLRSIDRRGVSRHRKPLIIAAAPMEVVIDCLAIEKRLPCKFACGCGSTIERQYRKLAPEQRQRKEKNCVLTKGCSLVNGRSPEVFDAPHWRIFFGGSTPFLLYANKRNGVERNCHRASGDAPVAAPAEIERQRLTEVVGKYSVTPQ